jgi:hypothetical protein
MRLHINTGGATLSNCFCGLYDANGNLIGQSTDQSGVWTGSGNVSAALSAVGTGLSLVAGQFYYGCILTNGTTQPTFTRGPGVSALNVNLAATVGAGVSAGSGLTALPATQAPGTWALQTVVFFVAVS